MSPYTVGDTVPVIVTCVQELMLISLFNFVLVIANLRLHSLSTALDVAMGQIVMSKLQL